MDLGSLALADLHIHMHEDDPPHRGCSVEEIVEVALERNVKLIGVVEHYPGGVLEYYGSIENYCIQVRKQIKVAKERFPEVEVLLGLEASILTVDGELNIRPEEARKVDFLLVGMHHIPAGGKCLPYEMKGRIGVGDVKGNPEYRSFLRKFNWKDLIEDWQEATLSLMRNPLVSIYAHPVQWPLVVMRKFLPKERWHLRKIEDLIPPHIAQEIFSNARKAGIAWEVNNGYLPVEYRVDNKYVGAGNKRGENSWSGMIDLFRIVGEYEVKVSLGTDAHVPMELERVGRLANAIELLRLAGVSKENIILKREQIRLCGT
ncbi:MAG: hypothetical protein DRJ49_05615 [Thermoprotei archaeon]|nr:MAG: hypothetical protein DRJ49_05615 [Thermoprotei archaeon]